MAKRNLREVSVELRKNGLSYSEIKQQLGVAKSTLSVWLKDKPLSLEQKLRLNSKRLIATENYRDTMAKKRQLEYMQILKEVNKDILPLSHRELKIGGLFLYWGEGGKTNKCQVSISNSDPRVLVFAKRWLTVVYGVLDQKMRVRLTLYSDMNVGEEVAFWMKKLDLPVEQFRKVRVKVGIGKSNGGFQHGTCEIVVTDTAVKTEIMAGLEAIGAS